MFGIGLPELIVIAVVALIFIGPKNLPRVLRSLGKGLVQVKRATNEVRETVQVQMDLIEKEVDLNDLKETASDLKENFSGVKNSIDSFKLNRMSTDDQLDAVADVLDNKEKETEKLTNKNETEKNPANSADSISEKS